MKKDKLTSTEKIHFSINKYEMSFRIWSAIKKIQLGVYTIFTVNCTYNTYSDQSF